MRTLVWFRGKDLRISDHVPLRTAAKNGEVIPLFVVDPYFFDPERAQEYPHRMQFLLDSLHALARNIEDRGSRLVIMHGKSVSLIPELVQRWKVDRVVCHRWVEPIGRQRDARIANALGEQFVVHEGETLIPPGTLRTQGGKPYAVFSQFARTWRRELEISKPVAAPRTLPAVAKSIRSEGELPTMESLGLTRNDNVQAGGEKAARKRLNAFVRKAAGDYADHRDRMDLAGTSRLSADLKFGTISPRQVWTRVIDAVDDERSAHSFLNELIWREFSHSTLWDRPKLLTQPFRPKFKGFPWKRASKSKKRWSAWVEGTTGYPVVDAASRQLLGEGFVHNRARMITASFLTKHLMLHYKDGEAHFMKYLTDGDWAQNNAGWQWSAGCGCDAQPYFRVFNPMTQGEKFDPQGDYVRKWVPQLAKMPAKFIHQPWTAPDSVLEEAGVDLGTTYPRPIVDHKEARELFLSTAKSFL